MADPATISNGHVVLNGVKREHEHEVVMTLAGLFKVRNPFRGTTVVPDIKSGKG